MVRIFQSDLYKMISVLELKSVEGVFYKSKASFLLPIIEMGLQSERKHTLENRYEEFLHIVS